MAKFKEPGFDTRAKARQAAAKKRFRARGLPVAATPLVVPAMPWGGPNPFNEFAAKPCDMKRQRNRGWTWGRWDSRKKGMKVLYRGDKFDQPPAPRTWCTLFKNAEEFIASLKKRGFVKLGNGFFSTVLAKPGCNKVVKVCHNDDDDCYPLFAEWAHQNPSPFLPVIHSFKRHNNFYVCVLDRLEKTVERSRKEEGHTAAAEFFGSYARQNASDCPVSRAMSEAVFSLYPGFKPVLEAFKAKFEGVARFDMHSGNWMVSKTGQLVMTDPLAAARSANPGKVTRIKSTVSRSASCRA